MRILSWLFGIPVAVVLGVFSVSNRDTVRLDLWPLPFGLEAPVYLLALSPLAVGFLMGLMSTVVVSCRLRARIRASIREVRMLERRTEALKLTDSGTPDPTRAPVRRRSPHVACS